MIGFGGYEMKSLRGKVLDDRYECINLIGTGGMSYVYKAFDRVRDCYVAIKVLKEEYSNNEEFIHRFKNETKANASLSHPNIVRVFDVGFGDSLQYIVMEYIEGVTLKEFISSTKGLNWKDAVHFTFQILRGLQHAHDKGIVHRDIKPQNIMLLEDGTVKIMDFGIARFPKDERIYLKKAVGSVHYISPEQAAGGVTDYKSDIYSVGIIMYEMLTGQLPFKGKDPKLVAQMQLKQQPISPLELNPNLPKGLVDITLRAMRKKPQDRYQTADEMLRDIDEFKKNPNISFGYRYAEEIENTRYFGLYEDSGKVNLKDFDKNEESKSKGKLIPILLGITGSIFLVAVVMVLTFIFGKNKSVIDEIKIPNFVGMNYEEIKTIDNGKYRDLGFIVNYASNEDYPANTVISQSIPVDTVVKKNFSPVKITVSLGSNIKNVAIPNVVGMPISKAESKLRSAGFSNINFSLRDGVEGEAANTVLAISPNSKKEIPIDTEITLFYCEDSVVQQKSATANVPSVVGLGLKNAESALTAAGFSVAVKKVSMPDKPFGVVIDQSRKDSAELGSTVEITFNEKREEVIDLPLMADESVKDSFDIIIVDKASGRILKEESYYNLHKNSKINVKVPLDTNFTYIVRVKNRNTQKVADYAVITGNKDNNRINVSNRPSAFRSTVVAQRSVSNSVPPSLAPNASDLSKKNSMAQKNNSGHSSNEVNRVAGAKKSSSALVSSSVEVKSSSVANNSNNSSNATSSTIVSNSNSSSSSGSSSAGYISNDEDDFFILN